MENVLLWIFDLFSYLVSSCLSFKILGEFSLLHLILGFMLLSVLFKFFTFGENNTNSYINTGIRSYRNFENSKDKNIYINSHTGEVRRKK